MLDVDLKLAVPPVNGVLVTVVAVRQDLQRHLDVGQGFQKLQLSLDCLVGTDYWGNLETYCIGRW